MTLREILRPVSWALLLVVIVMLGYGILYRPITIHLCVLCVVFFACVALEVWLEVRASHDDRG